MPSDCLLPASADDRVTTSVFGARYQAGENEWGETMGAFLKASAKTTTIFLVELMGVFGAGGLASGDGVSRIAGVLGFMVFLWSVLFPFMIPVQLLMKLNRRAAIFGASLGKQAVNAPRKDFARAIEEASAAAMGKPAPTENAAPAAPRKPPPGKTVQSAGVLTAASPWRSRLTPPIPPTAEDVREACSRGTNPRRGCARADMPLG